MMRETVFKGIEKEYEDLSTQMNFVLQETIAKSGSMQVLVDNIRKFQMKGLNSAAKTKTALLIRYD